MRAGYYQSFSVFLLITWHAVSCTKGKSTVVVNLLYEDSIISVTSKGNIDYSDAQLRINNPTAKTTEFYITPEDFDFFSTPALAKSFADSTLTNEAQAIRLWKFVSDWTFHQQPLSTVASTIHEPAAMLNGFQYGICDDRNAILTGLAIQASIPARVYELGGHVVAELFYDSAWHMFDADKHVFFRTQNGTIASVDYLSEHPEVIDSKESDLYTTADKIRNKRTRNAITSTDNNRINTGYYISEQPYDATIALPPRSTLVFRSRKAPLLIDYLSKKLMARNGPSYFNTGEKSETVTLKNAVKSNDGSYLIKQQLPYPVTKTNVITKNSYHVYYSTDGESWYFKGVASGPMSGVTFRTARQQEIPFSMSYWLKLVPVESDCDEPDEVCRIVSTFTFSDKILINNPSKKFNVVFLNSMANQIKLGFDATTR